VHCSSHPRSAPLDRSPRRCSSTTPYKAHFSYNALELEPQVLERGERAERTKTVVQLTQCLKVSLKRVLAFINLTINLPLHLMENAHRT